MWRKVLSCMLVFVLLISCMPVSAASDEYRDYRDLTMTLSTPGLPQVIKCSFRYDTALAQLVDDYPGFEPEGFYFPLTSDTYDDMYDLDYHAEAGLITFVYTLKPGFDLEYLEDCLDKESTAKGFGLVSRGENALHTLSLFHAAVCFKVSNWHTMSAYTATVQDMVLSDGTVMMRDGKRLSNATSHVYPNNLRKPDPAAPVIDKYRELALSQYRLTEDQLSSFEVFYEHQDSNGAVDWALVRAKTDSTVDTPAYYEFGNRVLIAEKSSSPLTFGVGVYNAKRNRFFDITECSVEDYPELEVVWTELGGGRLIGDTDGDNSLTVSDAAIIQRCAANIMSYPEDDVNPVAASNHDAVAYFSDFDADGDRGVTDATMIQRYLADMPYRTAEWSPYEEPIEPMRVPDDPTIPHITGFRSLGSGIEISIAPVPGAEKYRFYFKNKNGNWEKMGETTGAPFVSTNNIEVGKTYSYTVRCIKADLSSFTSDFDRTGWSHTYDPQLDTPQITRVEAATNGVKVTWTPVEGAGLYRVYCRHSANDNWKQIGDTDTVNYVYSAASEGYELYYTVRCLSKNGNGFASAYDPEGVFFCLSYTPELLNVEAHLDGVCLTAGHVLAFDGDLAVYRKEKSGWKRIGVIPNGGTFTDTDAVPGNTYTYTCRCLSEDGSYFVSKFNSTGWTQRFTVDKVLPELEYVIYMGEDVVLVQPKNGNRFDIPKFAIDICDVLGDYLGTFIIEGDEPIYLRASAFKEKKELKFYFIGLNENEDPITAYRENGFHVDLLRPRENLRVVKLDDRKYRFRWDEGKSGSDSLLTGFSMIDVEGAMGGNDLTPCLYYDVDLSGYSEDVEWTVLVYTITEDELSSSAPITIEFRESDFNSKTE